MSTKNILEGKGRPARRADKLAVINEPTVQKMWEPKHLATLWASSACYRDTFTFFTHFYLLHAYTHTWKLGYIFVSKMPHLTCTFKESTEEQYLNRRR
jgi:hypothetical protein